MRSMIVICLALPLAVGCAKSGAVDAHACVDEHGAGSPCGAPVTGAALTAQPESRVDPTGATVLHAGAPFAGAAELSIADLVTKGEGLKGQTVRVAGQVAAMCHHKRGWFAVVTGEPGSPHVRVLTAPGFLVPEGSIGKRALAEGVVDVIEINAETAQHYAHEHKLGEPAAASGPVKQVIVRATGAEFL